MFKDFLNLTVRSKRKTLFFSLKIITSVVKRNIGRQCNLPAGADNLPGLACGTEKVKHNSQTMEKG